MYLLGKDSKRFIASLATPQAVLISALQPMSGSPHGAIVFFRKVSFEGEIGPSA